MHNHIQYLSLSLTHNTQTPQSDMCVHSHSLLAGGAENHHALVLEVAVGLAAQGAAQALVALLIAAVTHRVVEMPAGARPVARRASPTVAADPTVLQRHMNVGGHCENTQTQIYM